MKKQSPVKQRPPQKLKKEEGEANKPEIPASRIRGKRTSGVNKGVKQNQTPKRILSEKEYWEKLTESATLWIWQTDANLRHIYSNPFVTKYLGYEPADFLQLDTLSLIHPGDHALVAELVRKARTEKAGWHDQLMRWRHRDGSWRFVESSGWPLFDDKGNFAGMRGADKDVTDRVLMKQTLDVKETAIASSNNGISFASLDGNLTYVNQAFLTMWGYGSEKEVLGRSASEFWVSPEAALRVIREISVAGDWRGELTARKKDGSHFFVELAAHIVKDSDGRIVCLMASFIDITKRKETEEKLRESQDRFKALTESTSDWIWEVDENARYTYASPKIRDILGYGPHEVIGKTPFDFMPPDEAKRVAGEFSAYVKALKPFSGIINDNVHKEGRLVTLETSGVPLLDDNGTLRGYRGIDRDITERRQIEQLLVQNERKYRLLFESSTDAIFILDLKGNFIDVNKTAYMRLGYTKEEMLSFHVSKLDPPEFAAKVPERLALIEKLGMAVFESAHVRKDGSIMPVEINCRILDYEGRRVYFSVIRDITERKAAEKALLEREALLRQSQAVAQVGHYVLDMDSGIWNCSEMLDSIFGIGPGYTKTVDGWLNIVHPDMRSEMLDYFTTHVIRDRNPFDREYRIVRVSDGAVRHVHGKGSLVYDPDGRPLKMFGTIQDVTKRKQREEKLEKINAGILSLAEDDHAGNLNILARLCGELLGADCALYNRLDGELLCVRGQWSVPPDLKKEDAPQGHICFDVIKSKDANPIVIRNLQETAYMKTDANVAAYGLRTYIGSRVQFGETALGSLCVVYARDYEPTRDDLDIIAIIATAIAQEEKRNEAMVKFRKSESFVRNILDAVDEGFIVIDRDYRIVTANKAYCNQAGVSSDAVIGKNCYEISHRTFQPCYEAGEECAVKSVFETGKPHTTIHRHTDINGNLILVETKAYPIKYEAGSVTSVIETINNITAKHLLEEERLKTQKLESIGILAGGIAHDFNNLLQGIFGYTSLAMMSLDRPEMVKDMLQQAEKALHLAVNLTTQLLTFSKGGRPVKKLIRLSSLIENAVKFSLSGSQTSYQMDLAADLWPVEADEGQLAQAIQNIVLNADQAMAGSGTVNISAANRDIPRGSKQGLPAGGHFVQIVIQDTGIGITKENVAKIFDPYFTTKQKGSGLGLATTYSIIRNHGGIIEVESTVNKGSTFTIYLPAAEGTAVTGETTTPAVPAKRSRILVMDDEEVVRSVAKEMITALGHEVQSAPDGKLAIEMFMQARISGNPFDLVIFDLTVKGGMGGEEAIMKLREIDPSVIAIVSSGYSDSPVVADFPRYGFSGVLNKPYRISELRTCLNELLNRS